MMDGVLGIARTSGDSAGCRYEYVLATYANLFAIARESIYRGVYEPAAEALFQMQRFDGAFTHPEIGRHLNKAALFLLPF